MRKNILLLLVLGTAACDLATDAETRDDGNEFPLRANWSATINPVGAATVRGNLTLAEFLGSRLDANTSITGGAPTTAYHWRIFRGDCTVTVAAAGGAAATGLLLFGTIQSYPDLTTSAAGAATVTRQLAGTLDSLQAYSVRVRVGQVQTNWNGTSPVACGNMQRSAP